jgi:HEAT repeat protein
MKLPRPPGVGRARSRVLWVTRPEARALALRGDLDGLLARLDAPDRPDEEDTLSERALVACALGSIGTDAQVCRLSRLLRPEETAAVRGCAADALRRIGGPAAAAALVVALDDENWAVQDAAVKTLETTHVADAWPGMARLATGSAHASVRMNAAGALGEAKSDAWIPTLEAAAHDPGILGFIGAGVGLKNTETPAAIDALRRLSREGGVVRRLLMWWGARRLRRKLRRRGDPSVR